MRIFWVLCHSTIVEGKRIRQMKMSDTVSKSRHCRPAGVFTSQQGHGEAVVCSVISINSSRLLLKTGQIAYTWNCQRLSVYIYGDRFFIQHTLTRIHWIYSNMFLQYNRDDYFNCPRNSVKLNYQNIFLRHFVLAGIMHNIWFKYSHVYWTLAIVLKFYYQITSFF